MSVIDLDIKVVIDDTTGHTAVIVKDAVMMVDISAGALIARLYGMWTGSEEALRKTKNLHSITNALMVRETKRKDALLRRILKDDGNEYALPSETRAAIKRELRTL